MRRFKMFATAVAAAVVAAILVVGPARTADLLIRGVTDPLNISGIDHTGDGVLDIEFRTSTGVVSSIGGVQPCLDHGNDGDVQFCTQNEGITLFTSLGSAYFGITDQIGFMMLDAALSAGQYMQFRANESDAANNFAFRFQNQTSLTALGTALIQFGDVGATVANLKPDGVYESLAHVGTPGTGVTVVESGAGHDHMTVMTLTAVPITIGDAVSLATGSLIYTLPVGEAIWGACSINVGLTLTTGTPTTDMPEICLGTVIGSGAVATCGAVGATSEDILGPAVMDDIAGTAEVLTQIGPTVDNAGLVIATADAHTLHVNFADAWADVTDTAATADGTISCEWKFLE